MSFKRQRKGSKKGMGVLLILIVVAVMFYYLESSDSASQTVPQIRMEFAGGESISFYQPVKYSEEISMNMADTALAKYFVDQQKSNPNSENVNRMITEDDVDMSVSAPINENVIGGEIGTTYYTRKDNYTQSEGQFEGQFAGHKDYEVIEGVPTFTRGHMINIIGKIEKADPAPYFYNIIVRMGENIPIRSGNHVETNYDGTFLYNFPSDTTWRTGTYTATISTIGDDNSILTFDWVFDIVE